MGFLDEVSEIGTAIKGTAATVADTATAVRASYDKVIAARDGVMVTPSSKADSPNPSPALTSGKKTVDALLSDTGPWYRRPKVLLSIAGVLALVLAVKVIMRRRGRQ
jgi:hypothetical protein